MRYEARFTPTVEDDVTAHRMRNRQSDVFTLCVIAAALFVVIFGVAAYVLDFPELGIMGVILAPGAFMPVGLEWLIRRRSGKIPQEELRFCFSEDGVEFASSVAQSKHAWNNFTEACLDERGLLLFTSEFHYSFIPARAFTVGYFPRQELKSLLAHQLKNS